MVDCRHEYAARFALARVVVIVVICLGHVGLVVVLWLSDPYERHALTIDQEPLLVSLLEARELEVSTKVDTQALYKQVLRAVPMRVVPVPAQPSESEPSTAPSLIPLIDFGAEVEDAVRDSLARQAAKDAQRQFGAVPGGMKRPPKRGRHEPGDTERFEGGEVVTWINDRCYYSSKPPPGSDPNPLRLMTPTCKGGEVLHFDYEKWRKEKSQLSAHDGLDGSRP